MIENINVFDEEEIFENNDETPLPEGEEDCTVGSIGSHFKLR